MKGALVFFRLMKGLVRRIEKTGFVIGKFTKVYHIFTVFKSSL